MTVLSSNKKHLRLSLSLCIFLLLGPQILFAGGNKEEAIEEVQAVVEPVEPVEPEIIIEKVTDMQDRYNSMSSAIPGIVMFQTSSTTIVSPVMAARIDDEFSRQLVTSGKMKPVLLQNWLTSNYFERKANNPFTLLNAIKAENYIIPLQYLCKPYLFRYEKYYILHVNIYSLAANGTSYPVSILRMFETEEDIPAVIGAVLDEMQLRLREQSRGTNKKRIVVHTFTLDLLRLVALDSGEFEFIKVPFIDQYGVPLRGGDDFFSLMLGYILSTTNLYQVMRPADFSEYARSSGFNASLTDYVVEGRVQFSSELSILYVTVRDIRNNSTAVTIQYPLFDGSFNSIWNAYREISVKIIEAIEDESRYGIVPPLSAPGRGMYINNMFAGWDTIENLVLPKGRHEIDTGSYFRAASPMKGFERPEIVAEESDEQDISEEVLEEKEKIDVETIVQTPPDISVERFFIFLDTMEKVFTDRNGEYVWNFLNKE